MPTQAEQNNEQNNKNVDHLPFPSKKKIKDIFQTLKSTSSQQRITSKMKQNFYRRHVNRKMLGRKILPASLFRKTQKVSKIIDTSLKMQMAATIARVSKSEMEMIDQVSQATCNNLHCATDHCAIVPPILLPLVALRNLLDKCHREFRNIILQPMKDKVFLNRSRGETSHRFE